MGLQLELTNHASPQQRVFTQTMYCFKNFTCSMEVLSAPRRMSRRKYASITTVLLNEALPHRHISCKLLTLIELWTSSSHTTRSPGRGKQDIKLRFASYPELNNSPASRQWKDAIHFSSSSAYQEFPERSLDPLDPTKGKSQSVLGPTNPFGIGAVCLA